MVDLSVLSRLFLLFGGVYHNNWYQSHAPNLIVWVGDIRSPQSAKGALSPYEASWALDDLTAVLLLHVRRVCFRTMKMSNRMQFVLHVRSLCPPRGEES